MAITIKTTTPPKREKKAADINISAKTITTVAKPAVKYKNDKNKDTTIVVDLSKHFLDTQNTMQPSFAYVDTEGDLIMYGIIDNRKICVLSANEENLLLEVAAWDNRPDVDETDTNKTTTSRAPRITLSDNMIDIAETPLGAWTAHVKNIDGINDILPSKRTYYSLATGEQLESGVGKGIDYKRRYMCRPEDKDLAINKLKAIIKANPKAGKDIEWFI